MGLEFSRAVTDDVLQLVCGDLISAEGMSRTVFAYGPAPDRFVIKVETEDGVFQNTLEWLTWAELKDTPHARWLAPCHAISPNGRVLLMTRVKPLPAAVGHLRLPAWLTDVKRSNYGMLGGQVVACDYGMHLLLNHGAFGGRQRKVKVTE